MRDIESSAAINSIIDALLVPAGAPGIFGRTEIFERTIEGLNRLITDRRESGAEVFTFPPVMSRSLLETAGYLKSFPHLLGCVSCLSGDEPHIRGLVEKADWVDALGATDLVLTPAACYPIYPLVAARGVMRNAGRSFDVSSYCFRRESTHEAGRLQSFRMREHVCIGTPELALQFRQRWITRAEAIAQELALPYQVAPASDPFFGRMGKLMAMSQVEQALKFEMLIPVLSREQPTACMSFNYHLEHFSEIWDLRTEDGALAHTTCVAFGLERLALALFATHGITIANWPATTRAALGL